VGKGSIILIPGLLIPETGIREQLVYPIVRHGYPLGPFGSESVKVRRVTFLAGPWPKQ
jgi:hypothetical protein